MLIATKNVLLLLIVVSTVFTNKLLFFSVQLERYSSRYILMESICAQAALELGKVTIKAVKNKIYVLNFAADFVKL